MVYDQLLLQSTESWLSIVLVSLYVITKLRISTAATNSFTGNADNLAVECRRLESQSPRSNEVAFFANESVLFRCHTPWESANEMISWSINERRISESDCPQRADSHCAILGSLGQKLSIKNLMPADSGNVRCHTNDRSSPPVAMTVTDPTVQGGPAILLPWNQTAAVGSNVTIVFITKYADVYLFWREGTDDVIQTRVGDTYKNMMDGNLHITNVSEKDEGKYVVQARNSKTGQTRKASKYLKVEAYEESTFDLPDHRYKPSERLDLTSLPTTVIPDSQRSREKTLNATMSSSKSTIASDFAQAETIVIIVMSTGIVVILIVIIIVGVFWHKRMHVVQETVTNTNHIVRERDSHTTKHNAQWLDEVACIVNDISRTIAPAPTPPVPSASASDTDEQLEGNTSFGD